MKPSNELHERVIAGLTGAEQLRALMKSAGYETYRDFAVEIGRYVQEVSMCLQGHRKYEDIRDALAEKLSITREQVDLLIDGPEPAEVA